jgi:cytosine/adenosine deaminase-related metal-dependent hydrolase
MNAYPYPSDLFRLKTEKFSSNDQLLTLALAAAGPDFANLPAAEAEWKIARQADVRITVHAGLGDPDSLVRLNANLEAAGELGLSNDTTYVHTSNLSDESWALLAGTGGTVSLAVPVEMQMGHGTPPIQRVLDLGLRPSLSVDVETNNPTDMFHQMRSCFALQRGLLNVGHYFGDTSHVPRLLTARQVLEFATIEGAIANGLGDKVGTLSVGKSADFLLLNARAINVAPINDPVAAVVLGMDTSNVEAVFVEGKPRKWQGQLLGVNVEQVISAAEAAQQRLYERAPASVMGG